MSIQRRHLMGLGGAAVVVVGAAALLLPADDTPPPAESPLAFPGLADRLGAARQVEVTQGAQKLLLQRRDDGWVLPAKGGYPAQAPRVHELLTGLTELRLAERRTADPAALGRLGLDEPGPDSTAMLLRVMDANGAALAALVIGHRRARTAGGPGGTAAGGETAYVRRPGESQSYLAEGRLSASADPQLWIEREIAAIPHERVLQVTGERDGARVVLRRGEGPDGQLRIAEPADAPAADEVSLDEVGRALEGLTLLDVRPLAEMPGEPAGQGHFLLTDGLSVSARLNQQGADTWLALEAAGGEEAARLNARWRGWAYQVGAWKLPAFAPSLDTLRKREG